MTDSKICIALDFQTKDYKEPLYISKNNYLVKTELNRQKVLK